jgi:hypothetical protein
MRFVVTALREQLRLSNLSSAPLQQAHNATALRDWSLAM